MVTPTQAAVEQARSEVEQEKIINKAKKENTISLGEYERNQKQI